MNRPPIKIECPECGGSGYIGEKNGFFDDTNICVNCDENSQVYNYLTPEQWEAETGEKMLDSDPVLYFDIYWTLIEYGRIKHIKTVDVVVARPGQPKPPGR